MARKARQAVGKPLVSVGNLSDKENEQKHRQKKPLTVPLSKQNKTNRQYKLKATATAKRRGGGRKGKSSEKPSIFIVLFLCFVHVLM